MCGRFTPIPRNVIEMIVQEINTGRYINTMPDWPAHPASAYPGSTVSVMVPMDTQLTIADLVWGYDVSWKKGAVFNTRMETALSSKPNMWRESLSRRRCVVPTMGFFEPHKTETAINPRTGKEIKRQYAFAMPNGAPLFIGGVYDKDHFSIVTTAPNSSVSPVHDRMPLVLTQEEINQWLHGEYAALGDRQNVNLFSQAE